MCPDVVVRKRGDDPHKDNRKIIVDILKTSAIIADNFTGSVTLNFNQGGLTGYEKVEKGII